MVPMPVQNALQVLIGLVVIFVLYRMSLWILHKDQLVESESRNLDSKHVVRIVDGFAPTSIATDRIWNTVNPDSRNYAPLKQSYNRKGGAQFSYSFWLKMPNITHELTSLEENSTILMQGDSTRYNYNVAPSVGESSDVSDVLIKCPRIRFGKYYNELVVELNTLSDPNVVFTLSPRAQLRQSTNTGDETLRLNALKLAANKWALYTFTFEDNVAVNDFEDGIIMRAYINDFLYHTYRAAGSALKLNNGDFYLLPKEAGKDGVKNGFIGDVTHYNYAMSPEQVHELFEAGPPTKMSTELMSGGSGDPLFLSEYNKLDIYNTGA
jgi:hypothetical protein